MKLIALKLLRHFDRYNAGEVAGFEPHLADQLIGQGLAKPYDPDEAEAVAIEGAGEDMLAAREADLAAREAALADREAALAAAADGAPPKKPVKAEV